MARVAGAGIVAAEFFNQFNVAMHDPITALHIGF
jgi:hypothetical protein